MPNSITLDGSCLSISAAEMAAHRERCGVAFDWAEMDSKAAEVIKSLPAEVQPFIANLDRLRIKYRNERDAALMALYFAGINSDKASGH